VTLTPRQPQAYLPVVYGWGDLFVYPTVEDGYAVVLAQAAAAALPILTTTNCSGPDLVRPKQSGWIVPIRSPYALVERTRWCGGHRTALAAMSGARTSISAHVTGTLSRRISKQSATSGRVGRWVYSGHNRSSSTGLSIAPTTRT
jgi:glycosyltransferase involved in cell wall biosynthesis